jgi:hypothetical protein
VAEVFGERPESSGANLFGETGGNQRFFSCLKIEPESAPDEFPNLREFSRREPDFGSC